MRLNKTMSDAFVRAALADVPTIDYTDADGKLLSEAVLNAYPDALKEAIKKDNSILDWIPVERVYINEISQSVYLRCTSHRVKQVAAKVADQLTKLAEAEDAQCQRNCALKTKLTAAVAGCSTLKQLKASLPEFEKYMPTEPDKGTNLPALANVVSDFMAAGWPKKGE